MPQYEVVETPISTQIIKRTDEDGKVWWIPADPANSDYQAYLKRDEPQASHLPTE